MDMLSNYDPQKEQEALVEKMLTFGIHSLKNTYADFFEEGKMRGIITAVFVNKDESGNRKKVVRSKLISTVDLTDDDYKQLKEGKVITDAEKLVDENLFGSFDKDQRSDAIANFVSKALNYEHNIDIIYYYKYLKDAFDKENTSHFIKDVKDILYFDRNRVVWKNIKQQEEEYKEIRNYLLRIKEENKRVRIEKSKKINDNLDKGYINWKSIYDLLTKFKEGSYYHNDFDIMLLFSRTEKVIFLPMPVLSSVNMFAFIGIKDNNEEDIKAVINDWKKLYREVRASILHYVLGNITEKMKYEIEMNGLKFEDDEEFVERFVEYTADFVLPIGYCLNEEKEENCKECSFCKYQKRDVICRANSKFDNEKEKDKCKKYEKVMEGYMPFVNRTDGMGNEVKDYEKKHILDFNLRMADKKEYHVRFFMPTFYYNEIKNENNKIRKKSFFKLCNKKPNIKNEAKLINEFDGYTFHKRILKERIEDTFELLYKRLKNEQEKQKHALLSATAKVFLRTNAHNSGSHVLSRLGVKQDLDLIPALSLSGEQYKGYKIKDCFTNGNTNALTGSQKDEICKYIDAKSKSENLYDASGNKISTFEAQKIKAEIRSVDNTNYSLSPNTKNILREIYKNQFATFNSYLKTRMEFLADFVTGTPQTQNTKFFVKDIFDLFQNNKIMLNRISGLNDFEFSFCLDIEDDIKVAISNDVLGQQAIYIILENIIRNTAKHTKQNSQNKKSKFTIRIREATYGSYYKVVVFDDNDLSKEVEKCDEIKKLKEEKNTVRIDKMLTWLSETEGNGNIRDTKKGDKVTEAQLMALKLNTIIDCDVIHGHNYQLREDGLGMIEMTVSAAYLRKIPVEDIQKEKYKLVFDQKKIKEYNEKLEKGEAENKIFRAVPVKEKEDDADYKYLGFEFYLPKPKEILIVDDKGDIINGLDDDELEKLEKNGILVVTTGEQKQIDKRYKYKADENYDHALCILNTDKTDLKNNVHLPTRKISWGDLENKDLSNPQEFIIEAWKKATLKFYEEKELLPKNDFDGIFQDIQNLAKNLQVYNWSFAHHGKLYANNEYYEVHGSNVENIVQLISVKKNKDKLLYLKFLYDSITNVIIFDERIQQFGKKKSATEKNENREFATYHELWKQVNVFIPVDDDLNLGKQVYDKQYFNKIINIINNDDDDSIWPTESKGVDIVVIHLGVLEKLLKVVDDNKIKTIEDLITKIKNGNKYIKIILTSGRGQPKNIPDDIPFISYSILSQYLIEKRFKLLLTESLYLAKPKTK